MLISRQVITRNHYKTHSGDPTTTQMNIKDLHPEAKSVSVLPLFKCSDGNVAAIQIATNEQLKEHITKIPALLVCISGEVIFENEQGLKIVLTAGDYLTIEPYIKHWINATTTSNLILVK